MNLSISFILRLNIVVAICMFAIIGNSQKKEKLLNKFNQIKLTDLSGDKKQLETIFSEYQYGIILFLNDECPICHYYAPYLNSLDSIAALYNVKFIGVFSGSYKKIQVNDFKTSYNIKTSLFIDTKFKLAKSLDATVTPEIFFISLVDLTVKYKGLIDDKYLGLGLKRSYVTQNYILEALENYFNRLDFLSYETKPIGCMINY